jgi:thiosulfate dehydrogenase [quinone] large subunit
MIPISHRAIAFCTIFLRLAVGVSFLSAVADRFGLWGSFGRANVAWGDFTRFSAYVKRLNPMAPAAAVPVLAWASTMAESVLGVTLIVGWQTRVSAVLAGLLLAIFALAMTFAVGIKAPLDASVFSASAGALLLACAPEYPWSLDALLAPR